MNTQAQNLKTEIDNSIKNLAALTTEAARSEAMKRYLDTCARFHHYSPCNQMLIALTCPDASLVAGFNRWKDFNRFVKRGEKGIPILAPIFYRQDPSDEGSPVVLKGFKVVYVFDLAQTDGEPLPPPPDWKSPARSEELQNRLVVFAQSKGIQVEVMALQSEIQGTSAGGRIELSPEAGTKTLIHEIAHELMHHGCDRHLMSRAERELEAKAVAYVVGAHFGLDGLASPNYLALWDADETKILARMDRIRTTADRDHLCH